MEGHDRKFDSRLCVKQPAGVCSGCNGKQEAGRKAGRNTPPAGKSMRVAPQRMECAIKGCGAAKRK
ncbi:hypothetical protein B5G04_15170 [Bacteroides sp. An51A]|nr:hypothetical protein B5G04_15170 [Bacteroides sp. An51A]RYT87766.1 hypothetical protein EAJ02_20595 [Phocaeicola dorei]